MRDVTVVVEVVMEVFVVVVVIVEAWKLETASRAMIAKEVVSVFVDVPSFEKLASYPV